jgi:hypothetical protein
LQKKKKKTGTKENWGDSTPRGKPTHQVKPTKPRILVWPSKLLTSLGAHCQIKVILKPMFSWRQFILRASCCMMWLPHSLIITGSSLEISAVALPHWRRGLRLQPVSAAAYWVGQTGAGGSVDSRIHPRHPSSHGLGAREIPSIESLVMSCNNSSSKPSYRKKTRHFLWCPSV